MKGSYIFEKLLDTFHDQQFRLGDRVWTQGNALTTWLILGNAGALVLIVSSSDTFCSPSMVRFSATCFATGLVLTFAGLVMGFFSSLWSIMKLADLGNHVQGAWIAQTFIDGLEDKGIEVPEDAELNQTINGHQQAMLAGQKKLRKGFIFAGIASAVIASGAVSFSIGVLHPLLTANPFEKCVAADASVTSNGQVTINAR